MFDANKTRMIGLPYGQKKLWPYVKPFSCDTGTLRTDGQAGGQTNLLYQYRSLVCWRAIKTVESAEYTCQSQQYQQCCHLANGNKTCRSLLLLKNNNVSRGCQGFVRQSSRNVALRVEYHLCLTSFFSELQYSAAFRRESRKFAGGVWKYAKFRHFLAHPVV